GDADNAHRETSFRASCAWSGRGRCGNSSAGSADRGTPAVAPDPGTAVHASSQGMGQQYLAGATDPGAGDAQTDRGQGAQGALPRPVCADRCMEAGWFQHPAATEARGQLGREAGADTD